MESSANMYIIKGTEARSPFMTFEQKTGIPYKDEVQEQLIRINEEMIQHDL